MESGWKKVISLIKYNCIPKAADDETKVLYLKMIGDYHRYTAKTGGREKSKDRRIWSNFDSKKIEKHLLFCFWDLPKSKQKIPSP